MSDSSHQCDPETESSDLWKLSGMGMELFGSIAAAGLVGWLIDRAAGSGQRWLLICLIVGIIVGGFNFFRRAMAMNRRATETYRRRRRAREARQNGATPRRRQDQGWFEREVDDPDRMDDDDRQIELPPDFDDY